MAVVVDMGRVVVLEPRAVVVRTAVVVRAVPVAVLVGALVVVGVLVTGRVVGSDMSKERLMQDEKGMGFLQMRRELK